MKIRNKSLSALLALFIFISSCGDEKPNVSIPKPPEEIDLSNSFFYEVNLNDRSGDTFKVRLFVDDLNADNAIFQFPAATPGTYDIHDIGRFVTTFKVYDEQHHELGATKTSTNQWTLTDPENTRIIEFAVKETFDTPVTEHSIYKMAGTSIENDHVLFNAFDVLGYPTGLKDRDFYLDIEYSSLWDVGTSLLKDENGFYHATDYHKLVDNPILVGKITSTSTTIDGVTINVNTYSKTNLIQSSDMMIHVETMLDDASEFLNGLPSTVDRYSFIFFFDLFREGALEHSYSSVYIYDELAYTPFLSSLKSTIAHEFFHVVTPLNIHSEIIENFNYAEPTPSEHLWLYEGVTEWASHMMQYRNNGHISLQTLLDRFEFKKSRANYYRDLATNMSLSEMSLSCYSAEGGSQYSNVYYRGALVAALLDIRLLELSGGTRGLREVMLDLIATYGPENAFSEETFFDDLATLTGYPIEVTDFINNYIKGTEELPINEYFSKMGISYDDIGNAFTISETPTTEQQALRDKWSVNF